MRIDPVIYTGGAEGRTEKEMRTYAFLDGLGIAYSRVDHDFADTIEQCHAVEEVLGCEICKNLFLTNRQETEFYLLLMPGDKPFKTKLLSKQIGSARLSFASPAHMERYLDITPGSVSVMGLLRDREQKVRLLIDRDLMKEEYLGCHPCINSSTLKLRMEDLTGKVLPALHRSFTEVELPWELSEE